MSDIEPTPDPAPVQDKVDATQDNIDALKDKLDNSDLTPTQAQQIEAKIAAQDKKLDALLESLAEMKKAPVAPSPRKDTPPVKSDAPSDTPPTPATEPTVSKKRGWYWGDRSSQF